MKALYEKLEFPICVKKRILMIKGISNLDVKFIAGKNIKFKNTNLALHEPHKVIISNNCDLLVLLYYEDENAFYLNDLLHPIPLLKLKNIVEKMINT